MPAHPPNASTAARGSGSARQAQAASANHHRAMHMIALATVAHILRSRRFYQRLITIGVVVRALGQIGQENQASTMARLAAWDKRQVARAEWKAKAQGRAVKGSLQMARSGAPGSWARRRTRPEDRPASRTVELSCIQIDPTALGSAREPALELGSLRPGDQALCHAHVVPSLERCMRYLDGAGRMMGSSPRNRRRYVAQGV